MLEMSGKRVEMGGKHVEIGEICILMTQESAQALLGHQNANKKLDLLLLLTQLGVDT